MCQNHINYFFHPFGRRSSQWGDSYLWVKAPLMSGWTRETASGAGLLNGELSNKKKKDIMELLDIIRGPDRELNSVKVLCLDNLIFNNELHYTNISELRTYMDVRCNLCNKNKPEVSCKKCRIVKYCCHQCRLQDSNNHHDFCEYFQKAHIHKLDLVPQSYVLSE